MIVSSIAPAQAHGSPPRLRRVYERPSRGPEWVGRFWPSIVDVVGPRVHIRPLARLPLIQVATPQFAGSRRVGKAAVDYEGGSVLLLLALPLFAGVALAIKLDDGCLVFDREHRLGQCGRLSTTRMRIRSHRPRSCS